MFTRLLLILCLAAAPVAAQSPGCTVADVPFSFEAMNTTMTPGSYSFCASDHAKTMKISPKDKWGIIGLTHIAKYPDSSVEPDFTVVFNKYGDHYFLHQVRTPLMWTQIATSKREKALVTSTFITALKVVIPARPR